MDKKIILEVYSIEEEGQTRISWEFKEALDIFSLAGILEAIKSEVLNQDESTTG